MSIDKNTDTNMYSETITQKVQQEQYIKKNYSGTYRIIRLKYYATISVRCSPFDGLHLSAAEINTQYSGAFLSGLGESGCLGIQPLWAGNGPGTGDT